MRLRKFELGCAVTVSLVARYQRRKKAVEESQQPKPSRLQRLREKLKPITRLVSKVNRVVGDAIAVQEAVKNFKSRLRGS